MKAHIFHVLESIHGQHRARQGEVHIRTLQAQNVQLERSLKDKDAEIDLLQNKIKDLEAQLDEMMDTDSLTGLPNRESFKHHLLHSIKRALRLGYSLSVLVLDIDHLRDINKEYGQESGDLVLTKVAKILRTSVREVDMAARWDGDELIAVLHETDAEGASLVAQRIQKRVLNLDLTDKKTGRKLKASVSVGVAGYTPCCGEAHDLITEAREALASVKKSSPSSVS